MGNPSSVLLSTVSNLRSAAIEDVQHAVERYKYERTQDITEAETYYRDVLLKRAWATYRNMHHLYLFVKRNTAYGHS